MQNYDNYDNMFVKIDPGEKENFAIQSRENYHKF